MSDLTRNKRTYEMTLAVQTLYTSDCTRIVAKTGSAHHKTAVCRLQTVS